MKHDFCLPLNELFFSEMSLVELFKVGVHPFLARGRLLVGRPLFFWRFACSQPRKPALPAREGVAVLGDNGRALCRDDVGDLVRRRLRGSKEV